MPTLRKADRRTSTTRSALRSAFVRLVLIRGYAAVIVADVIAGAKVSRSTFYLHFHGKLALLRDSLETPCEGLAACVDRNPARAELVGLLRHFFEQRQVNRVFFEEPIRSIWVRRLSGLIARKLRVGPARGDQALPRALLATTLAELQIALVINWLKDGSVDAERMAQSLIAATHALAPPRRG